MSEHTVSFELPKEFASKMRGLPVKDIFNNVIGKIESAVYGLEHKLIVCTLEINDGCDIDNVSYEHTLVSVRSKDFGLCGKCGKKYKPYLLMFRTGIVNHIAYQVVTERYGERICKPCRCEIAEIKDPVLLKKILAQSDFVY